MVFVPTFFFVSVTPGMCMTLALSLGMTVGVKRALWMMLGELAGVGLVACLAVIGVAALMLQYPQLFLLLKYGGGLYLAWLGLQLWRSRGKLALNPVDVGPRHIPAASLVSQGFVTAIANPKGWAFFIALLPPFIDNQAPLAGQLVTLVSIILTLEFICLLLYASGGRTLSRVLQQKGKVQLMNRIAGSLMLGVALWLALG
ncbi:lysine exporter protein LysE/YggA [Oceanimonas sp. GK1]|uniref:LysE family translocator n=1 Tax=Oceanimonas sp. (strain GK1 / IBRC-M 10197) TaxID=511062 RepID=UPI00024952BA|nr:LysE family translocator [Oceanimonas sp. GK1]AEY00970.1 lysine exporter protein LysE/YggA [Oceanimonas sp. GK1]